MCWRARSHPSPRRSRSLWPPWGSVANDMPASRRPSRTLAKLLGLAGVRTVSVIDKEAHTVLAAFSRYGKGRGHPAQLNLGDCFAYAVAKNALATLLFKGEDFDKTDILAAIR